MDGIRVVWRLTLAAARACWNLFAVLCIVAGANADVPDLFGALDSAGLIPFLQRLAAGAWSVIRAEPLGFAALVAVATLIARQLAVRRRERSPPEG